ncbi:hypothetical protein H6P81_021249 [Aristolochia fimbriata]|uniref:Uncharacterized protein n=1 Tax=Aristolochia fimbriata TaxID=158543 RepID=A0AAV7DQM1_ARIFI|nr:hypothetical protein H6P81_021249 [Aristolochia fimbriata]
MGLNSVDRGSKATLPLTIPPRRRFKSPAKDSNRRRSELCFRAPRRLDSAAGAPPRHAPLGSRKAPNAGRQAGGGGGAGRADIGGSKSNAAMNALAATSRLSLWPPQRGRSQSVPPPGIADDPPPPLEQLEQSTDSRRVRLGPRAQPSSQSFSPVTDPFCRLPLPTLFHRPEAVHLGDLMRYEYDQARALGPPDFQGVTPGAPTPRDAAICTRRPPARLKAEVFMGQPPRPPTHRGLAVAPTAGMVSASLGTVNPLSFIPHRQFCLPKMAHLSSRFRGTAQRQPHRPYLFKSSPLYPSQTNDLHRQIAAGPPPEFLWLRPPGIVHHLSVPAGMLTLEPFSEDLGRSTVQPARGSRQSASFAPLRTGRMGSPLADAKSAAGPHEGTPARSLRPPSSVTETTIRWRDHPPGLVASRTRWPVDASKSKGGPLRRPAIMTGGASPPPSASSRQFQALFDSFSKSFSSFPHGTCSLSVSRRYLAFDGIYRLYLGCIPKQPDFADNANARRRQGPGTTGCHPLWRPIPWDLRPSVAEDASADYTNGEKPPILILGSSRSPLLGESFGCSHLTWGRIRARPPGHGGNCRAGVLSEPGARHPLRATQGQGGRSHHCRAGRPWGKVFFSQPRQGGQGRPPALPPTTHTAPSAGGSRARGGENTPGGRPGRLDGSRDSAIHTKYRIFATLFIDARAKISAVESRLGYRVRGIRRALRLPRPPPPRHRGAARSLGRASLRGIDNDPSAGSVDFSQRIGRRTANAAADPNTSPTIQSVGATGAGITAAAGTGLALQWILAKGFRLYLFPLPDSRARYCYLLSLPPRVDWDQPGSILSRDRDANTPMRKGQHRARGIDGRKQKLGDQTRLCESNQVHRTAAFTWVHEHCVASGRSEHTRAETKPEGKVNADARLRLACTRTHDTGPGDGFQRDYTSYEAAPFGKKKNTHKHQGNASDPTRPLEVRAVKGRRRDETTAHTGRKHHSRCPTHHHSHAAAGPHARCPARMAKQQRRHRRRTGKSRSGEGAPNGPAESVKDQKLELGKRVARATWAFPPRERAEGHRPTEARGKWPLHCSHAEGQAIAQSARGATSPT